MLRKFAVFLLAAFLSGCLAAPPTPSDPSPTNGTIAYVPHVVLGIPEAGINPYHHTFYRPDLTQHPCTYIRDFPCDIPELRLTLGMYDLAQARAADQERWNSVERGAWYWIPQTVFVAVHCQVERHPVFGDECIFDEGGWPEPWKGHGTAVVSIALRENPEALIAFSESAQAAPFADRGIPVDIVSRSWGISLQNATTGGVVRCPSVHRAPILVKVAHNDGRIAPADCESGPADQIIVGGGYSDPWAEERQSGRMGDITSYYCPPWATRDSVDRFTKPGDWCGTSFAAPTVSGALSKVILDLRRASGYDGSLSRDGFVDPLAKVTIGQLRDAMNRTGSYTPAAKFATPPRGSMVALNPVAPWLQWGWGFYDGDIANATIAHLQGKAFSPEKPIAAKQHMASLIAARQAMYK